MAYVQGQHYTPSTELMSYVHHLCWKDFHHRKPRQHLFYLDLVYQGSLTFKPIEFIEASWSTKILWFSMWHCPRIVHFWIRLQAFHRPFLYMLVTVGNSKKSLCYKHPPPRWLGAKLLADGTMHKQSLRVCKRRSLYLVVNFITLAKNRLYSNIG